MLWTWMRSGAGLKLGVDRSGRSATVLGTVNEIYHLDVTVVNPVIDQHSRS